MKLHSHHLAALAAERCAELAAMHAECARITETARNFCESYCTSTHGRRRARERVGWTSATTDRMIDRVLRLALDEHRAPRAVRRYIADRSRDRPDFSAKIFGEHVFIFHAAPGGLRRLVTVHPLPPDLRRLLRGQHRFPIRPGHPQPEPRRRAAYDRNERLRRRKWRRAMDAPDARA